MNNRQTRIQKRIDSTMKELKATNYSFISNEESLIVFITENILLIELHEYQQDLRKLKLKIEDMINKAEEDYYNV